MLATFACAPAPERISSSRSVRVATVVSAAEVDSSPSERPAEKSLSAPRRELLIVEAPQVVLPSVRLPRRSAPALQVPDTSVELPGLGDLASPPPWSGKLEVSNSSVCRFERRPMELPALKVELPSLAFEPGGARLRPRSPYNLPGHLPLNSFCLQRETGLPVLPGVY